MPMIISICFIIKMVCSLSFGIIFVLVGFFSITILYVNMRW